MTVPRQALRSRQSSMQLHLSVGASQFSYGAIIYAKTGKKTNIIFCKTRIMPVKKLMIPRAELMATIIGKRALDFVTQELKLEKYTRYAWSDSKCVLAWLAIKNGDKRLRFERNKVGEV